jgi:hypothetical protein
MRIVINYNEDYLLGIDNIYDADLDIILSFTDSWIDNLDQADGILELMALVVNGRINNWKNIHLRE